MNLVHLFLVLYVLLKYEVEYKDIYVSDPKFRSVEIIGRVTGDDYMKVQIPIAIIVGIQWARVFFVFQASKYFGPLIKILSWMLIDVAKFFIIFGINFVIFLSAGRLMFVALDDFQDTYRAIVYLISACLGNFDYTIFNSLETPPHYFGYVYLISFLWISTIILLNFIIAILTNIYIEWQSYYEGLYLRQIVLTRQILEDDIHYSCLISAFSPLNLISFPFSILVLFTKSSRINKLILHFCYIPVLIFGVISLILSIILIPPTYVIITWYCLIS